MSSYTIANLDISETKLKQYYTDAKSSYPDFYFDDLDKIFEIALAKRDRFPGINLQKEEPHIYLNRWIKAYYDAIQNPPSKKIANPKTSCTDPAIKTIVQATQDLNNEEATFGEHNHALFMSAENIQGNLLEEYISLKVHPYGFLWCCGTILRAIDFCNSDGSLLLQIKNKSNTENSSSSNIREGTSIEKWFRLGTRTKNGKKIPDYKWAELNEIINANKTVGMDLQPCSMTENDYQLFLSEIASENKSIITDQ